MATTQLPHSDSRGSAEETARFTTALRQLRSAQKSSKGAPIYSLVVNRPLGRVFAAAAFRFGLTPNQVTAVSAVSTFVGIVLLATAPVTWWVGLLVSALLAVGYALDSADGQLARLRGGGSLTGEWLDHMIDAAKISSLHLAVLIMAARSSLLPGGGWLLVPMIFVVASSVHFFGMILVEQLHREHRARYGLVAPERQYGVWSLRSVLKAPTDYGILCWVFVLVAVPWLFGLAYAVLALGTTAYTVLVCRKWFREVRELDRNRQTR